MNVGFTWTQVFGGSFSGEFRYGLGLRSTNVDIAAGNDTPIVRFTGSPVSGTIMGNAGSYPINRKQTDNQFVIVWSSEGPIEPDPFLEGYAWWDPHAE